MKGSTRTPRQAAKREQIVGAASRVFAARPYHVVCMDDIAEGARVGKGTLYRYFPSKEDLYLGVVAEAFDLLIRRLERVEAGAQAGVFRKVDRDLGPSMLIGLVWGTTLNHADDTPAEVLAQRVADLCLHGILQHHGDAL
jgi:AcrR family transcriptional regulator